MVRGRTSTTGAPFNLGEVSVTRCAAKLSDGTAECLDRAAMLIVEMPALRARGTRLTGPGIEKEAASNLPDIAFSQANAALCPLGIYLFLIHGISLAALSRLTQVR